MRIQDITRGQLAKLIHDEIVNSKSLLDRKLIGNEVLYKVGPRIAIQFDAVHLQALVTAKHGAPTVSADGKRIKIFKYGDNRVHASGRLAGENCEGFTVVTHNARGTRVHAFSKKTHFYSTDQDVDKFYAQNLGEKWTDEKPAKIIQVVFIERHGLLALYDNGQLRYVDENEVGR